MTVKTKNWESLKKKISKKYKIGTSRIKFTKEAQKKIKETTDRAWPLSFAEELYSKKLLRILPKKRRPYKILYLNRKELKEYNQKEKKKELEIGFKKVFKTKNKVKPIKNFSYLLKRKIKTKKDLHMYKVREMRAYLKKVKPKGYSLVKRRIKGNYYKSLDDLKKQI